MLDNTENTTHRIVAIVARGPTNVFQQPHEPDHVPFRQALMCGTLRRRRAFTRHSGVHSMFKTCSSTWERKHANTHMHTYTSCWMVYYSAANVLMLCHEMTWDACFSFGFECLRAREIERESERAGGMKNIQFLTSCDKERCAAWWERFLSSSNMLQDMNWQDDLFPRTFRLNCIVLRIMNRVWMNNKSCGLVNNKRFHIVMNPSVGI